MLSIIIQKEIHDNLLNARFVAACLVSIILIISSVAILTESYVSDVQEYRDRLKTQDEFITQYGYLDDVGRMTVPQRGPSHYQPLVLGINREVLQGGFASNPMPMLFSRLDLVTIVTIIMSLMAILFSYNAISGEREGGLLKQMLSTPLSRGTIILGKFIGGCLSLLIPFTLGVLAGLVYIALNPHLQYQGADVAVIVLLLCISYAYITAFYGLGLLFSARSQSSNAAVIKSLFAWVILALVLPNASPFLAAQLYRIPSKTQVEYQVSDIRNDRFGLIDRRTKELLATKYADLAGDVLDISYIVGTNKNKIQAKADLDPQFKRRFGEFESEWQAAKGLIDKEVAQRITTIQEDFNRESQYQEKLATMFASVSPLANYVFVATDLADAGIQADNRWQEQLAIWWGGTLTSYLNGKIDNLSRNNSAFSYVDHVDLSDHPRLQYQPEGIGEKIGRILPHAGVLILFNLIFLAGAFASFLRYDVR